MADIPTLRVVPLDLVKHHEQVDPLRVQRLRDRIRDEGTQLNPMVCAETSSGELVLLDGATRTEALKSLGLEHAVVQIVDPANVELETWHHVIRQTPPLDVVEAISASPGLSLSEEQGPPRIRVVDHETRSVLGSGASVNNTLSTLVGSYVGRWLVSRVTDPSPGNVTWRFPDWSVVVILPQLSVDDVMKAAIGDDLLPAGVTRFLVQDRALRLSIDLSVLASSDTVEVKQQALDSLLAARARAGRIRRYEETVVILDD